MKLTPERVRSFLEGMDEAGIRELLRTVFAELTKRELGIAADELIEEKKRRGS